MIRYAWFALSILSLQAQDAKTAIKQALDANFAAMRTATSKEDILRAVDALDTPDWTSTLPNGQTWKHADVLRELESILTIPPAQRRFPQLDFIYWNETPQTVTVLYWVYNQTANGLSGSMARDTWIQTTKGWRRSRHEKFFPDRALKDLLPKL